MTVAVAFEDEEDSEGEPADNGSSNGLRNQRELKRTRLDPFERAA
jgi:hypothetical protein